MVNPMVKRLVVLIPDGMMEEIREESSERDLVLGDFIRRILEERELVLATLDEEDEAEGEDDETEDEEEAEEPVEEEKQDEN
jgi:Ran GTPase-activating protein (RanGAP) involved in mRNA processing and transport